MKYTPGNVLLAIVLGLFSQFASAQPICGFDIMHARKLKEDPSYRTNLKTVESSIYNYIQQHPQPIRSSPRKIVTGGGSGPQTLGAPYTIPVVVHVIHTGGAVGTIYNPDDNQIKNALLYLDSVYNGTEPGTTGVGDIGIQFVLAQRDPNCNPSNGINRVDGSSLPGYVSGGVNVETTVGTDEINVKNLSRWDNTQYYNVWIVNKIDGNDGTHGTFIAGYAYMPGASSSIDGIVMLATQMVDGQKTLPHEIGHAFNLYHPFEGSSDNAHCPPNNNCSIDGDKVCDTDPITYNYDATTGAIDFSCRNTLPAPQDTNYCLTPHVLYTDNTEANYMNYTTCYHLFTAGQAARMQASATTSPRLSLTTSLGGNPPAASGCSPKVDFELAGDQQTETTAATSGCRAYKDYTYNMVIGVAPSAAATVTLSASSGTAVQGLDYDLTTNGSFSSPSQQLTFPAGSITSQSFTIRVYDDASVNGTRNVTLGFTVNNGGGNAVIGNGRPNFTMIIYDNDKAPFGPTNDTVAVGSYETDLLSPFAASNAQYKSQILYYAGELTAQGIKSGNILGLALNIEKNSASNFSYHGLTIKMGNTSRTAAFNGSVLNDATFTTVYSSNYSTTNGWNIFTFSTPFAWNGTSNVAIEICYDNGASTDNDDDAEGYTDATANYNYLFSNINCSTAFSTLNAYPNGYKPYVQFLVPDAGTVVQSAVNSSQSAYLGPNADVYFYDQTNNQLMARIQNLTSFDYGCTQVVIDRAGSSATQFWNSNTANYLLDKTFHVLPTTNNPSGSYTITLYYTQAEISGWQTLTAQNLSSIQLVKVPGQISSVTPANPTGGGTVTLATPTIGTLGSNTALTYNFTNGFSGFGAGAPGTTPLPIGLLDFTGRLVDGNVLLNWSTSSEQNSKTFEIDRSSDGVNFSPIGNLPAAGNSSTTRNYSFTDPGISSDTDYYRLKEIDFDDRFSYSRIVLVTIRRPSIFTVQPNPFTNGLDLLFGQTPTGALQIRLLDIAGRELWRQTAAPVAGGRLHLNLPGASLTAGIYLLEVNTGNNIYVEKVLKQ